MAKILLLDFEESDLRHLLEKKYDAELKETNWRTGRTGSLVPPPDCKIVFYQVNSSDLNSGLHAGDSQNFENLVTEGGTAVCFIGDSQEFHLTNIIGGIPQLKFEENKLPDKIYEPKDKPFDAIFSRYRAFISHAFEIFPTHNNLGKSLNLREWNPPYEGELQVLAESFKNFPISALVRKGKGFYLLLPWFGEKNIEVVDLILDEILPQVSPQLLAQEEESWLDSYDYIFPGLLDIYKQMEEENERHRQNMLRLEEKIEQIKTTEQEPFNKLLTGEGAELCQAVIRALRYLDWLNVVDVDEYWKRVVRVKEEDIWLIDEDEKSIEELIHGSQIILLTARSGKGGAADEDGLLLQRYKGRRMQEFDNTRMKALLVGNYFLPIEAKHRDIPFTENQIHEAAQDGNGLLTTFELFKAIKAEKENRITKDAIREQIKNKVGLITFDY